MKEIGLISISIPVLCFSCPYCVFSVCCTEICHPAVIHDYCNRFSGGGKVLFAARHCFALRSSVSLWLGTHLESHLKGDINPSLWRWQSDSNTLLERHPPHFNGSLRCGFIFLLNAINMSRVWHTSEILPGSFNVFRCEVHAETPAQTGCNLCHNTE